MSGAAGGTDGRPALDVIQHTAAEYLGLIEDHLEGRQIRFRYHRPFSAGGTVPRAAAVNRGLIVLGGGPWGSAGPQNVPSLVEEVELIYACLERDLPVIGFGLGAQMLALAAGGQSRIAPLEFRVENARRCHDQALNGYLPETFVTATYGRDDFVLPAAAEVLAEDALGRVAVFSVGGRAVGFRGHPGFKAAIAEDLLMEFDDEPPDAAAGLARLRAARQTLEDGLVPIMTGLVQMAGWMDRVDEG